MQPKISPYSNRFSLASSAKTLHKTAVRFPLTKMTPSLSLPVLALSLFGASVSLGSVVVTANSAAPVPGLYDRYSFGSDAVISGGNYPYNISAYSDRAPGQTFTTPSGGNFSLTSFSLKGSGDAGGMEGATWTISVGTVSQAGATITFNSLLSVNSIVHPSSGAGDWLTWTFTSEDLLQLAPNTTYGIQVINSTGYMGFAGSTSSASYSEGTAFAASQVGWSEYPNPVDFGYDRTFVVGLTPVPEASVSTFLLAFTSVCSLRRRRK